MMVTIAVIASCTGSPNENFRHVLPGATPEAATVSAGVTNGTAPGEDCSVLGIRQTTFEFPFFTPRSFAGLINLGHDDIEQLVTQHLEVRRHHDRCVKFAYNHRPADRFAAKRSARDDGSHLPAGLRAEPDRARLRFYVRCLRKNELIGYARLIRNAMGDKMQIDKLDDAIVAAMAVRAVVDTLEILRQSLKTCAIGFSGRPRNRKFVGLAEIAHRAEVLQMAALRRKSLA